jgi:hypothetical protein
MKKPVEMPSVEGPKAGPPTDLQNQPQVLHIPTGTTAAVHSPEPEPNTKTPTLADVVKHVGMRPRRKLTKEEMRRYAETERKLRDLL